MLKRFGPVVALALLLAAGEARASSLFTNPSFESGDFTGWIVSDLSNPAAAFPLSVRNTADDPLGGFSWIPTHGDFAAFSSFDGEGPGTITMAQDIALPAGGTMLTFDYRAYWNLFDASLDRLFNVIVQPSGGGADLLTQTILTAQAQTSFDTFYQPGVVDLSAFGGQNIRVLFQLVVPEGLSTGPAQFELDNVRTASVPEPATVLLMAGGLAGVALRHRKTGTPT